MSDFKNSILGIICLGVISSLIAAYIWSRYEGSTRGGAQDVSAVPSPTKTPAQDSVWAVASKNGKAKSAAPSLTLKRQERQEFHTSGQVIQRLINEGLPPKLGADPVAPLIDAVPTVQTGTSEQIAARMKNDILGYLKAARDGPASLKGGKVTFSDRYSAQYRGEGYFSARTPTNLAGVCVFTPGPELFCALIMDKSAKVEEIYSRLAENFQASAPEGWKLTVLDNEMQFDSKSPSNPSAVVNRTFTGRPDEEAIYLTIYLRVS